MKSADSTTERKNGVPSDYLWVDMVGWLRNQPPKSFARKTVIN